MCGCMHDRTHLQRSEHKFQESVLSFLHGIWRLHSGHEACVANVFIQRAISLASFLHGLEIRSISPSLSVQTESGHCLLWEISGHMCGY